MNKSSFLTFLFAFLPGTGQMYLGMMKRGASLMLAFFGVIGVSVVLRIGILSILLPVIWCYAFFDTFNLKSMPYEQRLYVEDKFLFRLDECLKKDWAAILRKRHTLSGGILIVLGLYLIYNTLIRHLFWNLTDRFPQLAYVFDNIPTLIVAIAVIYLGIRLLRGAKQTTPKDDFVAYGGDKRDE